MEPEFVKDYSRPVGCSEREEWVKYDRKEVYEEICRAGVTSGASAAAELCLAAVEAEPSGKDGRFSTWNDVRPLPQDVELAV